MKLDALLGAGVVAIILTTIALTAWATAILLASLRRLREAHDGIGHGTMGDGPMARAFGRVQRAVATDQPVDAPGIADLEADLVLPPRLATARFIAQAAVYLGLMGALMGLGAAVSRLSENRSARTLDEVNAFVGNVTRVVGDFGEAFASAFVGVAATLILSAFIARVDARRDALATALESLIRDDLIERAGAKNRVDPAFEQLRVAAQSLGTLINGLAPALAQSAELIRRSAEMGARVMDDAATRLQAVGSEFRDAQQGLRDAMTDGSARIEASAGSVAASLGAAAEDAAGVIAAGARQGGELIAERLEAARLGMEEIAAATGAAAEAGRTMREASGQLAQTVRESAALASGFGTMSGALEGTARAQEALAKGIRNDLDGALGPIYEKLGEQNRELGKGFGALDTTLQSHRDFVVQLGEVVAQVPNAINGAQMNALVADAVVPVIRTVQTQNASLSDIVARVEALRAMPPEDPRVRAELETIRTRLDEVAARTSRGDDLSAEFGRLHARLGEIEENTARKGLFGRKR